jgi:hypothetical protein
MTLLAVVEPEFLPPKYRRGGDQGQLLQKLRQRLEKVGRDVGTGEVLEQPFQRLVPDRALEPVFQLLGAGDGQLGLPDARFEGGDCVLQLAALGGDGAGLGRLALAGHHAQGPQLAPQGAQLVAGIVLDILSFAADQLEPFEQARAALRRNLAAAQLLGGLIDGAGPLGENRAEGPLRLRHHARHARRPKGRDQNDQLNDAAWQVAAQCCRIGSLN